MNRSKRSKRPQLMYRLLALSFLWILLAEVNGEALDPTLGSPLSHTYSLDQLGLQSGTRLAFDANQRLIAFGGNKLLVLNDENWIDFPPVGPAPVGGLHSIETGREGKLQFGSLANWGRVELTREEARYYSERKPNNLPQWIYSSNFHDILKVGPFTNYIGNNGIVSEHEETGNIRYFEIPFLGKTFQVGDKLYASSRTKGILLVDLQTGSLSELDSAGKRQVAVATTALPDDKVLLVTSSRRFLVFDGTAFTPWMNDLVNLSGRIENLTRLKEGGFAVSIEGHGLFLLNDEGKTTRAFTEEKYKRIHDLKTDSPGLLWVATNSEISKILYGAPISSFKSNSNVNIDWPKAVESNGVTYIASNGDLYYENGNDSGYGTRFEKVPNRPSEGVYSIAASKKGVLIGNSYGAYEYKDGSFEKVLSNIDVGALAMVTPESCLAIGPDKITLLVFQNGTWVESGVGTKGVGYPFVVHNCGKTVWVELGLRKIARLTLAGETIKAEVFDSFPWKPEAWINLGVIGDTIVISGPENQRLYYDNLKNEYRTPLPIEQQLSRSKRTYTRIQQAPDGTIWASHENGAVQFSQTNSDLGSAFQPLELVEIASPVLYFTEKYGTWITNNFSLFLVDQNRSNSISLPTTPQLISITNSKTGGFIYQNEPSHPSGHIESIPYSSNSLSFQFFSGSYAYLKKPSYEYSMRGPGGDWSVSSDHSSLTVPALSEGTYQLQVRILGLPTEHQIKTNVSFTIEPPFYRTKLAYGSYFIFTAVILFLSYRRLSKAGARQQERLKEIVRQRTEELRETMEKLEEETRNSATLDERNRLAGEIHDSLQQSLSGLYLHLNSTLKLEDIHPNVTPQIEIAKKMVSYTRQELQQTIWDLESPLLENASLADALRNLVVVMDLGKNKVELQLPKSRADRPQRVKHNLLRIVQEAMTNSLKHSGNKNIRVTLKDDGDHLELVISDDGRGFEPDKELSKAGQHFGLKGMRSRASSINANFDLKSAPKKGTTIRVTLDNPESNSEND